ncbi:MAG TPA: DedA family protein [Vicinamibacteria bacterium]|nr:DedA family protein [Vicinamibacteria bacterium]
MGGVVPYLGVFVATVVEGEVVFVAASVLVHNGHLSAWGVYAAASLGGSIGDQAYFYALRGRLRSWIDRFPGWLRRRDRVLSRVQRHAPVMIFACRFLPGLRIAIPAACAYAGIPPLRFTAWSLAGSLAWAAVVMGFIAWLGPASLAQLGVRGWWTPIVPAALVILFSWWLGREPGYAATSAAAIEGSTGGEKR